MIKLIEHITSIAVVCDLDGTLICPETEAAPKTTMSEFCNVLSSCALSAFATGRCFSDAKEVASGCRLPSPDYWICELGTRIYDSKGNSIGPDIPCISSVTVARVKALAVASNARDFKCFERRLVIKFPEGARWFAESFSDTLLKELGGNVIFTEPDSDLAISIDFLPSGCNKWWSLRHLLERLECPADIVYFGDAENDLEPLRAAKWPVVMPNHTAGLMRALDGLAVYFAPEAGVSGVLSFLKQGTPN